MSDRIDADLDQLQSQAVQLKDQVERGLEDGDPNVFDMLKKKMQYLRGQIEDMTTKQQRVQNTLEHQHMNAGMARLVGSPRRVAIMEGFVLILIVLVLGLLAYEYIQPDEQARPGWLSSNNIFWIDVVCCLVFMVEFFMRRSCARCKRWFWKNHWIDFFTSIPLPGEAQLARFGRVARVARFARLLRFTRIIRAMRVFLLLWRGMDKLQDTMDVKLMKRSLKWGLIFMLLGGLLVFQLERNMADTGNDVTRV
ncbi:MAG: ion transporter, partial [Fuerstiella sp.]|nr:ion transporter [Fuerstiella sp.]